MANLTVEKRQLPALTNHARALKAFKEQSSSSSAKRQPSGLMALMHLEETFPHIPYTTLQQLYMDCGESVNNVVDVLTGAHPKATSVPAVPPPDVTTAPIRSLCCSCCTLCCANRPSCAYCCSCQLLSCSICHEGGGYQKCRKVKCPISPSFFTSFQMSSLRLILILCKRLIS